MADLRDDLLEAIDKTVPGALMNDPKIERTKLYALLYLVRREMEREEAERNGRS